ncbi:hypothetical protein O9992_01660 [Vibrio lentus]|nr:hypothetical protein [Vibrio lentus]
MHTSVRNKLIALFSRLLLWSLHFQQVLADTVSNKRPAFQSVAAFPSRQQNSLLMSHSILKH